MMKHASSALMGLTFALSSLTSTTIAAPAEAGALNRELVDRAVAAAKHPALLNVRHIEEIRSAELLLRSAALPQEQAASVDDSSPWVTVNDESQPAATFTPSATVVDGSTSWQNGAPHDLTADIYTWTTWGVVSTSTGLPPNPTATGKNAQGSFSKCSNLDGEYAPFCRPFHNSTLLTGNTYYITWDPDYYNQSIPGSNLTTDISVRVDWYNNTSGQYQKLETFDTVPAKFGFWPFKVEKKYIKGRHNTNITFTLLSSLHGSNEKNASEAVLPVLIAYPALEKINHKNPSVSSLVIALPVALGGSLFILIGVCLWNRKNRRINLGNVLPRRGRGSGYNGLRERRGVRGNRKDAGIRLSADALQDYPSHPDDFDDFHGPAGAAYRDNNTTRPRRDSHDLEDLTATPTQPNFQEQETTGGGNRFRDEMARQDRERRDEPGHL